MKKGPAKGVARAHWPTATETVAQRWGAGDATAVPEWITVLATMCDTHGRAAVAQRLSYSASVISQLLNKTYAGDLDRAAAVVRGAYCSETVDCPMAGEIGRDHCLKIQREYASPQASPWRQKLYRGHCRNGCPNFRGGPTK